MLRNLGAFCALGGQPVSLAQRLRPPIHAPQLPGVIQTTSLQKPQLHSPTRSSYQASHLRTSARPEHQYYRFRNARQSRFSRFVEALKPRHFVFIGLGASGVYLYNVEEVEMTGRRRFNCISHARELALGNESYREILASEHGKILAANHPLTVLVDEVLQDLVAGIEIEGADWRVYVIKDDENQNAFVLPGGRVFVYTGILPICRDTNGLAAVLGHEIAHVVAHHPAERMSNSLLKLGVVLALSLLFDVLKRTESDSVWTFETGCRELLTVSVIMSKACFNPKAAVQLWARMHEREKQAPPQFMSTHPSNYNRMEAIQGWLDAANIIYRDNGCEDLTKYGKIFNFSSWLLHVADLSSDRFPCVQ
ncbi:unnamed protein product [Penicillium salamii]|uniref:Peptidase M48 domain-containing protein n=1 Tax=Penicillium salamii TaxID=1612424 RepID=A0A9W4JZJ1_9EURO|nr:unnamed protein product [Penicillium salamii]CAG8333791.1 unnamed protein product [Penicillium salamii]CAG8360181.1 unnamed protein product [Penicillium salamii]CAG8371699.1 unnamed protein product [Penicillium salamii]CAG8386459.1 unnamed protein product [Penicillium salamii]